MEIHSPMDAVELSRIRAIGEKVQQLQKEGRDIVRLQIGEPDFTTPGHIIAAAKAAMDHGQTHYAPNRGLASLREEISRKLLRDNGITADPATEILVTSGCAEGLYLVFMGLVEPGDEVIILEPAYISYLQLARAAHARAVPVHAKEENGWLPDLDELRAAVTPKTKLLVLNTPGNPTGAVYPREVLQQIAALAQEQDFLVLSDEVYEKLIYDGAQHVSIASLDGMKERTITINGFSKAFAMTGFRLGYACGPEPLISAMMKIHQYSMLCAPITSQEAAIEALENGTSAMMKMRESYRQRRDFLVKRFNEIGMDCHLPGGAFYAFPDISKFGLSSKEFATRLLMEEQVAAVPGTAFGASGEGFLRCCYATAFDQIKEACNRMERFVKTLS